MRKQLFSMMLCLGVVGGASFVTPMPAMAAVAQDQVITVKGHVVDDQGEPLIGATVRYIWIPCLMRMINLRPLYS